MAEGISWDMPTFKVRGRRVLHVAAWKKHVSLYPAPSGPEPCQKELAPLLAGKSTIQLPLVTPVPYELVRRIVRFRLKEVEKAS